VVVNCHNTGDRAVVDWTPYSRAKQHYRELHGKVLNTDDEVQYLLHGAWDKGMTRQNPGELSACQQGICQVYNNLYINTCTCSS